MEKHLYRGALVLLLAAMVWFGVFAASPEAHSSIGSVRFNRALFVGVMLGSIPATVLLFLPLRVLLARAGGRVIWIKHPTKTIDETVDLPLESVLAEATRRLGELGFTLESSEATATEARIVFSKPKSPKVVRFVEHAFKGEWVARRESGRTRVVTTLVFQDIILLESGESERLHALARYLGGVAPVLQVATLPFTLVCGIVIALTNLALLPVDSLRPWLTPNQPAIVLGALGMILLGGYPILKHRGENHGLPLGVLGVVATLLPLIPFFR
ncbi:MAG: hypothetical protein JNG83_14890 [Opitutaceae bacterium]|nr:hypothetical protein [Opitutaceae bacterium]